MLVDHVTFSKTGGAGEVASILATTQNSLGIDARLLNLVSGDLKSEPFTQPLITVAATLDEYLVSNHSSPTILSLFRSRLSQLSLNALRSESVVHLHWLPGVFAHEQVRKLLSEGRKVVWTLHDMAPFTGVCHHSHGCSGFHGNCSDCPQVRNGFKKAVELNLTKKVFDRIEKNLILVAPTLWMASQARASSVFKNQRIEVIENPIRPEFLGLAESMSKKGPPAANAGERSHRLLLTAVASDLTNPAKGIAELVKIVGHVRGRIDLVRLQLVGARGESFHNPSNGIIWLGKANVNQMVEIARNTDLLVSASTAESAGLIVREFGALGVPTLAIRAGGIDELIQEWESGFLAENLEDLNDKLRSILRSSWQLQKLGTKSKVKASENAPTKVTESYLRLYSELG